MASKLSSDKKSGECCYPRCKCPYAIRKHKNRKKKKKPTKKEKKNARPYKTSKWLDGMALRPPGALMTKRMAYEGVLPQRILNLLDKYFEQSMQTVYSQRSRFVRENYGQPKSQPKCMDKKAWAEHRKWLSVNAAPRKDYSDRGKRRRRVPLAKLTRYKKLCAPKYTRKKYKVRRQRASSVKRKAMRHKASERTRKLARVLGRFQCKKFNYYYGPESTVTPNALKAKCSDRTRVLATAKEFAVEPMRKETKYGVVIEALKYKLSERTENLSKPRPMYVPRESEEDELIVIEERELTENGVSTSALKYKPSPKILEMSRPREPPMEPIPEFPYDDKPRTKYNVVANALKYKPTDRILNISKPR